MKRLISLCLLLTIIFSIIPTNTFAKSENQQNKAIIIVPGTLSSGLFYNGEENRKYYKNEAVWLGMSNSKFRTFKAVGKLILYYKDLFCKENGDPINDKIGLSLNNNYHYKSDSNIADYGVFDSCKELIGELNRKFGVENGGEYQIVLHNYDWRIGCNKNAELLTQRIMSYDEVILIGYSLGGLVSCKSATELLSNNELSKIKCFVSVAVPYNGTIEPLYVLEKGMITGESAMDKLIRFLGIPNIMKKLSHNCLSMYEMLPTKNYFKNSKGYVCNNLNKDLDYLETLDLLKSRPWSKKKDGTNKDFFEKAENFHDSLYINGQHIVNFIPSYFIVGSGFRTMSKILIKGTDKNAVKVLEYVDGDATIPLNESAIPPSKSTKDVLKVNSKHNDIFNNSNAIKYIVDIISSVNSNQTYKSAA